MSVAVELSVEADGWSAVGDVEVLIDRAVAAAERGAGIELADGAEVSIMLCDDDAIRVLNRDWRGLDKPTNVLSFPVAAPGPLAKRLLLGDIAIAWDTTRREAEADGKPIGDHLTHLAIHGFLHLVGFDHENDDEATDMERLETRILAGLGIHDPYAAEAEAR